MSPADADLLPSSPPGADALAVVVTAGVTPYLRRTLRAVARQTRAPGVVLLIDVASRGNGLGDGTPVEEAVSGSGLDARSRARIVRVPEAEGFGDAVVRGLDRYADLVETGVRRNSPAADRSSQDVGGPEDSRAPEDIEAPAAGETGSRGAVDGGHRCDWLWLLHDDAAPAPTCLEALLTAVAEARSAALVGPKQVDWNRPERLLEVGLRTTVSARRANDVVPGEIDQGQHDDRSDVLAVGTAGALIDRAVWEELGGTSPAFPVFDDGLELSRAVRLAGHRVVVVPRAVIRHRRASYLGLRPSQNDGRGRSDVCTRLSAPRVRAPDPDPERSFRARRTAQLTAWATFSTRPIGLLLIWFLVLGVVRAGWRLLTKSPALARDELRAALTVSRRAGAVRRGRRRLATHATVRRSVLTRLYVDPVEIRSVRRDRARQERERSTRATAPSELEVRELAALARRRRLVLAGTLAVAVLAAGVGLSRVLMTRTVTGGASAGLDLTARALWNAAWATWAASGDGYTAAADPLLAMLAAPVAVAGRLGLDGNGLVHLLFLAAVPLAALGAWFAAGTVTRRTSLRAWAALAWALAPALLLAVGQGRLTAVLVHLALPWTLTALARAVGADRRDVVLSGLVGAHHATAQEKADLDRFASERIEDLAELADDPQDEMSPSARTDDDDGAPAVDIPGAVGGGAAASGDAAAPRGRAAALARIVEENDAEFGAPEPTTGTVARRFEERDGSDEAGDGGEAAPPTMFEELERLAEGGWSGVSGPVASRDDEGPTSPTTGVPDDDAASPAIARGAAIEEYGPGSATAAAVAGLLLALLVAAAPVTAAVVVPCLLVLMVVVRRSAVRLVLTVLPVVATAAPAWWRAASTASADSVTAGLRYLLTDTGVPVSVPPPSAVDTLLGVPVDIDALTASPTLALAVRALLAILPALALCGLVTTGRRGHRARAGVLAALGGLGLALLAVRATTAMGVLPDGTGSVTVTGWAGTGISLATAGLLTAALAGIDAAGAGRTRRGLGARRLVLVAVTVLVLVIPLAVGTAWALAARTSTAVGSDAIVMALRAGGQRIPVIAEETQRSASAGRVVVLTSTPEGLVVRTWRGAGTQLTDVVPDVLAAQLRSRLTAAAGSADLPAATTRPAAGATLSLEPTDPADAELADIVTRAAAGQDASAADGLAAHGVAVVVLADVPDDETTALARAGLDSTPGLDELAQTSAGASWRVAPSRASESARASLVAGDGTATPLPTPPGAATEVVADLPDDGSERTLVLAERADAGWYATLDGEPLEAVGLLQDTAGAWRQAFTVPPGGGELVVAHGSVADTVVTRLIWVAWGVTALAALPLRRRRASV